MSRRADTDAYPDRGGSPKRAMEAERNAADQAEALRIRRIEDAGVDLYEALKYIAKQTGEKSIRAKA